MTWRRLTTGQLCRSLMLFAATLATVGCGANPAPGTGQGSTTLAILKQPTSQTVLDGQSATFSVSVAGSPPFEYQWLRGGVPIANGTQETLSIPVVIYSYNKSDLYSVLVTDASGSRLASQTAALTVTPRLPVITESPMTQTVVPGSAATFSVAASGSLPLTYQWNLNGVAVPNATAASYTSGANSSSQNNQDSYTVTVTNGAGQSLTSTPALLTVASVSPSIDVDCNEEDSTVAHQVTYLRGAVEDFDLNNTPSVIGGNVASDVQNAGVNFVNAPLDAVNQQTDEVLFDYTGPQLVPDASGSESLSQALTLSSKTLADPHALAVQISGTPFAFPKSQIDPGYEEVCGATGNFYPLPLPGAPTVQVQSAMEHLIDDLASSAPGAIWIGTQEPSHTLGYSSAFDTGSNCASVPGTQLNAAVENNIQRYLTYWTPIAAHLRSNHLLSGGIQLNAGNSSFYSLTAQQIMNAQMPLDYFTVQNYSPSRDVTEAMYGAYEIFQQNPAYVNVKVLIDRYGIALTGNAYGTSAGVIKFLADEAQLMAHAEMMYGYAVETTGIRPTPTVNPILPEVIQWLQKAPVPLRPISSTTSDLQAFALVQKAPSPRAYVALWNSGASSSTYSPSVHFEGLGNSYTTSNLRILDGLGNNISALPSAGINIDGDTISGFSLKPNEFLLISLE